MLKKVLSAAVLLAAVNASAGENYFANEWDAKGLIALEGSGGSMNLIAKDATTIYNTETVAAGSMSLKLGGESKHYRLFLAGTYYQLDDSTIITDSTAYSLGLQVDYLIRAGEHFNIFMGLNGGLMHTNFEYDILGVTTYDSNTDAYYGGQAGVNIDIFDSLGVEFGVRGKSVATADDVYAIDNMYEGYASIVFKFTGDY
ncbi:MAG: hypothetical protein ABFR02_06795 [Campylobacterota bacterium]